MKYTHLKKTLSFLLSLILVFTITGAGWQLKAEAAACNCGYTPVVYVHGHQPIYKTDENGNRIEFFTDDDEAVNAAVAEAVPLFLKAVAAGTDEAWNAYYDRFMELFPPFFDEITLNPDGTPKEGTGVNWSWDYASLPAAHQTNDPNQYVYIYDYRLSLYDEAERLNAYIEAIKQKTGHDKVILIGRCGGTNVVSAYLSRYEKPRDYAGVEKVIYLCSMATGVDFMEAIFSGNIRFNSEAFYRWVRTYDVEGVVGEEIAGYLYTVLDMLESVAGGTQGVCALLDRIYNKLKDDLIAPFLKTYFAINAGFVAFVNDGYEEYKEYVFSEPGDLEKYAAIIEYLDWYHYEVQEKTEEDLLAMQAAGVELDFITYYGDQVYPVMEGASLTSDTIASIADQSLGGTASALVGTLSDAYIKERTDLGFGDYISADKQIDASTGMFPETTWYVKNIHHVFHHGAVDRFLNAIARTKNATVDTVNGYSRFMNYNTETQVFSPLQEKNDSDTDWTGMEEQAQENGIPNFIKMVTDFIQKIIDKFYDFLYIILGPLGLMTKDGE